MHMGKCVIQRKGVWASPYMWSYVSLGEGESRYRQSDTCLPVEQAARNAQPCAKALICWTAVRP